MKTFKVYSCVILHMHIFSFLFFQSLHYIDQSTASTLLDTALDHCQQHHVNSLDLEVRCLMTQQLFCRCLLVPEETNSLVQELLSPLIMPLQFVWTVYPCEDNFVSMETDIGQGFGDGDKVTRAGPCFLDNYVENNSCFLSLILNNIDSDIENICKGTLVEGDPDVCLQVKDALGKLGLISYLHYFGSQEESNSTWLVNNLYDKTKLCIDLPTNSSVPEMSYLVNPRIARAVAQQVRAETLQKIGENLIPLAEKIGLGASHFENIPILKPLGVKFEVLRRLLIKEKVTAEEREIKDVFFGEDWSRDVTLGALMWRINEAQPQCQG